MKNPFGTKTYGGWGGESPKDENGNMYNGRAKAQALRKTTDCKNCNPNKGEFCGKHLAQSKALQR